jgi:formylglycine-generating enzyme required for sulfatase activity
MASFFFDLICSSQSSPCQAGPKERSAICQKISKEISGMRSGKFIAIAFLAVAFSDLTFAEQDGFARLDGGTFLMGSEKHYREEAPTRNVTLKPFLIKKTEVTNAEFDAFVKATGHITTAEKALNTEDYPNMPEDLLKPGSMVFAQPSEPVNLKDLRHWWRYVP